MDTQSVARPAHQTTRKERGQQLYAAHADEIRYDAGLGVWLVPSQNDATSVYEVTLGLSPSCECRDFDFNGHRELCKHTRAAMIAQAAKTREDLRIDWSVEEELLAAAEYALDWFEAWEEHANHENDFGGEHVVITRLRRSIRRAREEA